MVCYYNNEEATNEVLKDGWLLTGDMGRQDEDGFIYLVDRKKDVIVCGGENLYPVEIEDFLMKNDAIKDVAVIGLPDKSYKRPRKIIFAPVLRNATGKIEKPKLRRLYGQEHLVDFENQD